MARRWLAVALMLAGVGVMAMGYSDPTIIGRGARPYAYISVVAVGAMLSICGAMMWSDR